MDKVLIVRPSRKPISYKNKWKAWDSEAKKGHFIYADTYADVTGAIVQFTQEYGKKIVIIEDSTFFMTKYFMDTALEVGFTKFTNNALGYYNLIKTAEALDDDVRVYLINHLEETTGGRTKIKTIGKMLDEKVDIPSLLTIVLMAEKDNDKYVFKTNGGNFETVKSPEGLFESDYIENDLNLVDTAICEYWDIER